MPKLERNSRICADAENKTYAQVAAEHGISRQRVHQIAKGISATDRQRIQVSLNPGTDPAAAAARIRKKLGETFADQLRLRLWDELQRPRDTSENR